MMMDWSERGNIRKRGLSLPQELSSLQLTGKPVMVQRKKKPSGAQRKCLRKQKEATAAQQAGGGPGARGAHSGKLCTGTDASTEGSSRTKTPVTWWDTSRCPKPGEAY